MLSETYGGWVTAYGGNTQYYQRLTRRLDKHWNEYFRIQVWFDKDKKPLSMQASYVKVYSRGEASQEVKLLMEEYQRRLNEK